MTDFDYNDPNLRNWAQHVSKVFPHGVPDRACWLDLRSITRVLQKMCATRDLSHTLLPTGGGSDLMHVAKSREPNCLEWGFNAEDLYLLRPKALHFRSVEYSPGDDFFLLECAPLERCGLCEEVDFPTETITDLPDGTYLDDRCWKENCMGYDVDDEPHPLPSGARSVTRVLQGKFLLVAKRSYWNFRTYTYDGRHNRLSADEIHRAIYHRRLRQNGEHEAEDFGRVPPVERILPSELETE